MVMPFKRKDTISEAVFSVFRSFRCRVEMKPEEKQQNLFLFCNLFTVGGKKNGIGGKYLGKDASNVCSTSRSCMEAALLL